MKDKEGAAGNRKKARFGALSKDMDSSMLSINSSDDDEEYDNAYRYSDPEAAQRAYDEFQAEAEMLSGMKRGGAVDLSQCKVNTVKANKSGSKW
jgi:hypothetical protein